LNEPFPAEKLIIELTGKERHLWEGHDNMSMNQKHSGKICVKNTMLKLQNVLHTFPEGVATVKTEKFPFQFMLPNDLPPSFYFVGNKTSELRITYRLTARMGGENTTKDDKKPKYKPLVNKRLLLISHAPQKINFNINLMKEHQITNLFIS
jgi:Arrestin (or S-antigen), N-terminal domain